MTFCYKVTMTQAKATLTQEMRFEDLRIGELSSDASGPSQIIERFKALIAEGKLGAGTRLPAERDLACTLGVSRPTLRQALKALHLLRILETRPRTGTFVTTNVADIIKEPIHFAVLLKSASHRELMDTRILFEVHLAGLAAEKANQDDLEVMQEALAGMIGNMGKPAAWCEFEIQLHEAIARAAGNRVMFSMMETLSELLAEHRRRTVESLVDYHEDFRIHYRIFERVQRGDKRGAEDAMRKHFEYLQQRTPSEANPA